MWLKRYSLLGLNHLFWKTENRSAPFWHKNWRPNYPLACPPSSFAATMERLAGEFEDAGPPGQFAVKRETKEQLAAAKAQRVLAEQRTHIRSEMYCTIVSSLKGA